MDRRVLKCDITARKWWKVKSKPLKRLTRGLSLDKVAEIMASTASKAAATMSKTMATRGSNVPLKLLALPLSKQPELVYFYAHLDKKQRESQDNGKGKQPETTTDVRTNHFEDSKSGIAGEAGEAAKKTQEIADNRVEDGATFSQKVPQYISRATSEAAIFALIL